MKTLPNKIILEKAIPIYTPDKNAYLLGEKFNELIDYLTPDSLAEKFCEDCVNHGIIKCICKSTPTEVGGWEDLLDRKRWNGDMIHSRGRDFYQKEDIIPFIKSTINKELEGMAEKIMTEARQTQPAVFTDKLDNIITQSLSKRK